MQPSLLLLAALGLSLTAGAAAPAQEPLVEAPQTDEHGIAWGQWWALGPFEHELGAQSVVPDQKPEKEFKKMKPGRAFDGFEQDYRGKGKSKLLWTKKGQPMPHLADLGKLDFVAALTPIPGLANWSENAVVFLYREVVAPREMSLDIMFGSDDGVRCWVNGELKLSRNAARGVNVRDERVRLHLKPGINHLVFKINNGGGSWGFQMAPYSNIEQKRINAAIDLGVKWMLSRQLIDGSWGEEYGLYRNGATALAVYTLVKSGVSARHPAILEALAFLAESPTTMTYSAGCHLMALHALRDEEYLPWMEEILGDLLSWQTRQGVWGYPDGHPDLSCTQFAALGLRAAAEAGLEVPERAWIDLAEGVIDHQQKQERIDTPNALEEAYGGKISVAGFAYRPTNPKSATGSMSTAGIATLAICLEQLGEQCPSKLRATIERQSDFGLNWMITHWSVSSNPGKNDWVHYYLYGMERVGAFMDTELIGEREWYWEGAEFLCNSQGATGANAGHWGYPHGRNESATCFALLFLERASKTAFTDPHGSSEKKVSKSDPAASPIQVSAMSASPASFWISKADLAAMQGKKVVEVEYHGREPGGEWRLLSSIEAPEVVSPRERYAGRYTFDKAGAYEVRAIAILEDDTEITSGVTSITVTEATEAGIKSYPQDAAKNLMPSGQPQITASSGGNPRDMVDNKMVTRWVCAGNDATPTIEIELQRPVTADKILFTHARNRPIEQDNNPMAIRVRVWIDRDDPIDVEIDPLARSKSIMQLPEARSIRKLKFQILAATGGGIGAASVGFSEIELQGPRQRRGRR
jgi:hypothetical protein